MGPRGLSLLRVPVSLSQLLSAWVRVGNFLSMDSSVSWGDVHFLPQNLIFLLTQTHDFCRLHFHLACVLWSGKEIFKWFEAAPDCQVTRADSGPAHAESCKSLKCIAHNFLVPALLGSGALLG